MVDKLKVGFTVFLVAVMAVVICMYAVVSYSQIAYNRHVSDALDARGITVADNGIIHSPPLIIRTASLSEFLTVCKGLNTTLVYYYMSPGVEGSTSPYDGYYAFRGDLQVAYVYYSDVSNWNGAWPP